MPCEHYKDALIEAAATGAGPQGELRVHLAACGSCRATLEQEQFLFTTIDSGLRTTTNAEVPVSLLPRVRARLNEAVAPWLRWMQPLIFVSASVVLAFLIFLTAWPHHAAPENVANQVPVVAPTPMTPGTSVNPGRIPAAATEVASTSANPPHAVRNSTFFHPVASSNPEVLVPPDEREAFARLLAALNERGEVGKALLSQTPEKKDALVSVHPLQIADLEIEPLEGTKTEAQDGAGEKR
jgi:hypothetical protein